MRTLQRGATLIETMIGLLLGLFAILSMMSIYKLQANQAITTRTSSSLDGQVASAMLVAQLEIQKAGFAVEANPSCLGASVGPSGTANTDLVLVSGAALSGTSLSGTGQAIGAAASSAVTGNALVWHWLNGATDQCAGLVAVEGGLKLLPNVACSNATTWNSLTWPAASVQDVIAANTLVGIKAVSFSVRRVTSCSPFGRDVSPGPSLEVTTFIGQSVDVTSSVVSCIPNICQ